MKTKDKILFWSSMGTIFLTIGVIFYFFYLLFYPFKMIKPYDKKFVILTPEVKRGEYVKFQGIMYRYTDLPVTVSRQLLGTYTYYYPDTTIVNPKGQNDRIITLKIPEYAEPGDGYFIRMTYTYHPNFLRTLVYIRETEKFKIVDNKKGEENVKNP